jgi:pyridinium-3,5-biscarboxylic acid mononucleotide sulfurtransferase
MGVFMNTKEKVDRLKVILSEKNSVAVAYSGGVDSTLLLKIAYDQLGEHAVGVTAVSASLPAAELEEAQRIAQQIGARHVLLTSHETDDVRYLANTPNRCYFCKSQVYVEMAEYARENGFDYLVDGTNADDASDHRPGRQAAREHGVRSPLLEAGLTKAEIREIARQIGLPNWDKPAAACLSSRIPYGTTITLEMLSQVEKAEQVLKRLGVRQARVRHHQSVARIEVEPADFDKVLAHREEIIRQLEALGYGYVTLDLAGFRSGSLNKDLGSRGR